MKYKIFDVVKLNNGNSATILEECSNGNYRTEIVNTNGEIQKNVQVNESEISSILYAK